MIDRLIILTGDPCHINEYNLNKFKESTDKIEDIKQSNEDSNLSNYDSYISTFRKETEKVVGEIVEIKTQEIKKLQNFIPKDQLEAKHGGDLNDNEEYWPPRCLGDATQTFDENNLIKNKVIPFTYNKHEFNAFKKQQMRRTAFKKGALSFSGIDALGLSPVGRDLNSNNASTTITNNRFSNLSRDNNGRFQRAGSMKIGCSINFKNKETYPYPQKIDSVEESDSDWYADSEEDNNNRDKNSKKMIFKYASMDREALGKQKGRQDSMLTKFMSIIGCCGERS